MSPTSAPRIIIAFTVALALFVPGLPIATANHWTIDQLTFDDARFTHEDDGVVFNEPASLFHGIANKVVYPGALPGDGSLFLDARLSNFIGNPNGRAEDGFAMYAGPAAESIVGDRDILLPGYYSSSAWYGWWQDSNLDGVIDDMHDGLASGEDEFIWRGIGSGDSDATVLDFVVPDYFDNTAAWGDYSHYNRGSEMLDRTSHSESAQEWISRMKFATTDGGFLTTIQHFTLAGAARAAGNEEEYDITDPAALIDVDVYEGISADVEALYSSAMATAYPYQYSSIVTGAAFATANMLLREYVNPATRDVNAMAAPIVAMVAPHRDAVLAIVDGADGTAPSTAPITNAVNQFVADLTPLEPKEPNTVEDDFEGRAIFGGVGDLDGSYNTYPGYQESWHLFFSAYPRTTICAGAKASAGPVTYSTIADCDEVQYDPVASQVAGQRSSQLVLSMMSKTFLWEDQNKDSVPGTYCDIKNPSQFDAERNTCDHYRWSRSEQYRTASSWESHGSCETSSAKGGTFTIAPIGAEWTDAVLVRDYRYATTVIGTGTVERLSGTAPVTMRWLDECESDGYKLKSRDAIVFLNGETTYPLRVESYQSMNAFKDVELGIDNAYEYVRDVDHIPAGM